MTRWRLPGLAASLALLAAVSCARCGGGPGSSRGDGVARAASGAGGASPADAGSPVAVARSIDLKAALMVVFPEYRGVVAVEGRASLKRRYAGAGDWLGLMDEAMAANGFTPADAGAGEWLRSPQTVRASPADGGAVVEVSFPFDGETIGRVMQAPSPVSSLDLGLLLPRAGRGLALADETFEVSVRWRAQTEARAAFLAGQVVTLMVRNGQWVAEAWPEGWPDGGVAADGGVAEPPGEFTITVVGRVDGARVEVHRAGRVAEARYLLRTAGALP